VEEMSKKVEESLEYDFDQDIGKVDVGAGGGTGEILALPEEQEEEQHEEVEEAAEEESGTPGVLHGQVPGEEREGEEELPDFDEEAGEEEEETVA
jgi:hypothetical protein